jgi:hypothetical protein
MMMNFNIGVLFGGSIIKSRRWMMWRLKMQHGEKVCMFALFCS